jgi:hypothetical protein
MVVACTYFMGSKVSSLSRIYLYSNYFYFQYCCRILLIMWRINSETRAFWELRVSWVHLIHYLPLMPNDCNQFCVVPFHSLSKYFVLIQHLEKAKLKKLDIYKLINQVFAFQNLIIKIRIFCQVLLQPFVPLFLSVIVFNAWKLSTMHKILLHFDCSYYYQMIITCTSFDNSNSHWVCRNMNNL